MQSEEKHPKTRSHSAIFPWIQLFLNNFFSYIVKMLIWQNKCWLFRKIRHFCKNLVNLTFSMQ